MNAPAVQRHGQASALTYGARVAETDWRRSRNVVARSPQTRVAGNQPQPIMRRRRPQANELHDPHARTGAASVPKITPKGGADHPGNGRVRRAEFGEIAPLTPD